MVAQNSLSPRKLPPTWPFAPGAGRWDTTELRSYPQGSFALTPRALVLADTVSIEPPPKRPISVILTSSNDIFGLALGYRERLADSETADPEGQAEIQRARRFNSMRSQLSGIAQYESDDGESFDQGAIRSARVVVERMEDLGIAPAHISHNGTHAIVFLWTAGARLDAMTITAKKASLISDGKRAPRLSGIPLSALDRLDGLLQRVQR